MTFPLQAQKCAHGPGNKRIMFLKKTSPPDSKKRINAAFMGPTILLVLA